MKTPLLKSMIRWF